MKTLIQRVMQASVKVSEETVGQIKTGVVVLLGIKETDTQNEIDYLVNKILNLRIFREKEKHFEKSLLDVQGEVLVVSQFTLYGNVRKGRRPDFIEAAKPEKALKLYKKFVQAVKETGLKVEEGEFGADMQVELINDGPVTFMLEK